MWLQDHTHREERAQWLPGFPQTAEKVIKIKLILNKSCTNRKRFVVLGSVSNEIFNVTIDAAQLD